MSLTLKEVKEINKRINPSKIKNYFGHVRAGKKGSLQIDLMNMKSYKNKLGNRKYSYILAIIDIYSRYGWIIPLKDKTGDTIFEAFKSWYNSVPIKNDIFKVFSDNGSEFKGNLNKFLKDHNITHIMINSNVQHQVLVERWIRTLKEKIRDMWTLNNDFDWVSILPDIVKEYNNKIHSSIRKKPADVLSGKENPHEPEYREPPEDYLLQVGDNVRIMTRKDLFDKPSLSSNYTRNVFTVREINGNRVILDNGISYPRWKLLKTDSKPKKIQYKDKNEKQRENRKILQTRQELKKDEIKQTNIQRETRVRKQVNKDFFVRF